MSVIVQDKALTTRIVKYRANSFKFDSLSARSGEIKYRRRKISSGKAGLF